MFSEWGCASPSDEYPTGSWKAGDVEAVAGKARNIKSKLIRKM